MRDSGRVRNGESKTECEGLIEIEERIPLKPEGVDELPAEEFQWRLSCIHPKGRRQRGKLK
ncbi:hypothetical protein E5676_scaffold142G003070 [Cucumis melo var. makuwa]|uniref:Uncharacterized protein n=1 Tax=Cucumis melo var. makuwa TaxID=1194695 RepID=A0A5D3DI49_CUCMM|nr:hypothetical protein E5676_scaffold142G003070 [Cucumis melo var. makuwa]